MKLSDNRGVKAPIWYANELFRNDDINSMGQALYQNIVDLYSAMLADRDASVAYSIGGLNILWSAAMTLNLKAGVGVSKTGTYLESDVWGFVPNIEKAFVVSVPEDASIGIGVGGALGRVDTIQVRPVERTYNSKSRNFKDPITGLVSSALVDIRKEYGYEFMVLTGIEAGSPVAPTTTVGWMKLAEVAVGPGVSVLSDSVVFTFERSDLWTTAVSSTVPLRTSNALKDSVMKRDSFGRSKVVAPVASDDIATLANVTNHSSLTGAGTHGSAVAATINTIIHRDSSGRAKIAGPTDIEDIVNLGLFFDIIIDSNDKLDQWINHTGGLLKRVYIKEGTWTASGLAPSSGGGTGILIDLSAAGTRYIKAEKGSSINYTGSYAGFFYGVYRSSLPIDIDTYERIEGLKIVLNITNTQASIDSWAAGFYRCTNLVECEASVTINRAQTAGYNNRAFGFYNCQPLTRCYGYAYAAALTAHSGDGQSMGMESCRSLSMCIGSAAGNCPGYSYGMSNCIGVSFCQGLGVNSIAVAYGFANCKKMQQNKPYAACKTSTYLSCDASSTTAGPCADTATGGYNGSVV